MSGKVPLAAFCEEYDEDAHAILPETRQVAHRLSLKKPPIQIHHHSQPPSRNQTQNHNSADGASDSGYSSRTVTSSQSGPSSSGAKSPPLASASTSDPTTTTAAAATTNKTLPPWLSSPSSSSSTTTAATTALVVPKKPKSSHKERRRRSTMQVGVGAYPSGPPGPYHGSSSSNRSPSRSRPKARQPGPWDYDSGVYHPSTGPSTPVDPLDYSYYLPPSDFAPTPPPPPPPLPPSSQTSRYSLPAPPPGAQDPLIVPHSSHPSGRSGRSNSYQLGSSTRPLSFHGMTPGGPGTGSGFYNPSSQWGRYEYGPPLSASAYSHSPSFGPTHFTQQPPFYSLADYGPPPLDQQQPQQQQHQPHHHRERSVSRSRDYPKSRRGSMYGPPMVDNDPPTPTYDYDGEPLERGYSRDSRPPMSPSSSTLDYDEDYHRMPPPPLKTKSTNAAPRIIQKRPDLPRKSASAAVAQHRDHRQGSKSLDMAGMDLALPEQPPLRRPRYQRSRENLIPERSRSLRSSHRSSYRDSSALPARLAVEGARRRRAAFYHYDDGDVDDDVDDHDDHDDDENDDEIVEKQREAEQYQAAKVAKNSSSNSSTNNNKPTPLTEHALYKAKTSHRVDSDSGSQKSRSNSSRASDTRTHNGSNGGSNAVAVANAKQEEENKNITMTMNGVTMSFTQESVGGKKISLRAGDTGALELNIEGGKKPKKYLTSGSEYTGTVARRELEDARRPRDGRRSERASGRSSRSTYSGRFLA